MNNIWLALLTGLTTGGISCIAVQGGLLTSSISQQKDAQDAGSASTSLKTTWKYVATFLIFKIAAYTILGFLLGWVGSFLILSVKTQATLQLLIGLFLVGTAARLLDLHPIFRYLVIQPPKFIYKLAKKESKNASFFAPALLGALTVLMPCGVTQAMMVVALGTGSPLLAAAIMFAFIIGTSPVFFTLGLAALELLKRKWFSYVAAAVVAVFGIISLNGAMGLYGSPHTLQNYWKVISGNYDQNSTSRVAGVSTKGVQEATIQVSNRGYSADISTLKVGVPVKLNLITNNTTGCVRAFTIPGLNISKVLPSTGSEVVEFTPTKTGRLAYSCSMGMYTGSFNVVN